MIANNDAHTGPRPSNEDVASAFESLAAAIAGPNPSPAIKAQLARIAENVRKIRANGRATEGGDWT